MDGCKGCVGRLYWELELALNEVCVKIGRNELDYGRLEQVGFMVGFNKLDYGYLQSVGAWLA